MLAAWDATTVLPLVGSAAAIVVASIALYRTHFAPFDPKVAVGVLRLRVYPYRSRVEEWVIPAFFVTLAVGNEGARSGVVAELRLVLRYGGIEPEDNFDVFIPVVHTEKPLGIRVDTNAARDVWLEEAPEWSPFLVLPKATVVQHLVFQSGTWERRIAGSHDLRLQMRSTADKNWVTVERWTLDLGEDVWPPLLKGSPWPAHAASAVETGPPWFPEDLRGRLKGPRST